MTQITRASNNPSVKKKYQDLDDSEESNDENLTNKSGTENNHAFKKTEGQLEKFKSKEE
jgi:hypothetical protein